MYCGAKRIRIKKVTVSSLFQVIYKRPFSDYLKEDGEYDCYVNPQGAVFAKTAEGLVG